MLQPSLADLHRAMGSASQEIEDAERQLKVLDAEHGAAALEGEPARLEDVERRKLAAGQRLERARLREAEARRRIDQWHADTRAEGQARALAQARAELALRAEQLSHLDALTADLRRTLEALATTGDRAAALLGQAGEDEARRQFKSESRECLLARVLWAAEALGRLPAPNPRKTGPAAAAERALLERFGIHQETR